MFAIVQQKISSSKFQRNAISAKASIMTIHCTINLTELLPTREEFLTALEVGVFLGRQKLK